MTWMRRLEETAKEILAILRNARERLGPDADPLPPEDERLARTLEAAAADYLKAKDARRG